MSQARIVDRYRFYCDCGFACDDWNSFEIHLNEHKYIMEQGGSPETP